MYYVYVLKSKKTSELYIGYTHNLKRRLVEHNSGKNFSTKSKTPFELVYYEAYRVQADAIEREQQLKRFAQSYSALKKKLSRSISNDVSG